MIRLLILSIILFCIVLIPSTGVSEGHLNSAEYPAIIIYEFDNEADQFLTEFISDTDILTITGSNFTDHNIRLLIPALKRKNTNKDNHLPGKYSKSYLITGKKLPNQKKQVLVDQSFLKFLRISKMLC